MLTDLAALTPPLLVAAAFLFAAGAFIRHEMRRAKNPAERDDATDSAGDSPAARDANRAGHRSAPRSFTENAQDTDHE